VATKTSHSFLGDFLKFQADATNVRSLARAVLVHEISLPEAGFVSHGTFDFSAVSAVKTQDQLLKFLKSTQFEAVLSSLKSDQNSETFLLQLGRALDKKFEVFLNEAESGEIGAIQIPFVYLERRLQNARQLKFIMFSKFYGLTPEKIYATLPNL